MSTSKHRQTQELFFAALERPPERREQFLREVCGGDEQLLSDVRSLLSSNEASDAFLSRPAARLQVETEGGWVGRKIGRFKIVARLGAGTSGEVYLATQESPERKVAIKLLSRGLRSSTLRRFEAEAEVLARLSHPGIARVIESGTAVIPDGPQPYLVLEYVDGQPITTFVQERHCSEHERVHLLIRVCDAVQHLHQKGVLHRDLKAENVLVDADAQPRILDFGIARLLDEEAHRITLERDRPQLLGTAAYMSPERLCGDVDADTRSDVYSLGVLGYRMLTGRYPHPIEDRPLAEVARLIIDTAPRPLSTPSQRFAADLETIIATALAREKEQRYASANGLAADLRRYLADEPIAARVPSSFYRVRKFVRRNPLATAASALALAAILAGAVLATAGFLSARRAQARAELEQARSASVAKFLEGVFATTQFRQGGRRHASTIDSLRDAAPTIAAIAGGDLRIEARIRSIVGQAFVGAAEYKDAAPQLQRAIEIEKNAIDPDPAILVGCLQALGNLRFVDSRYEETLALEQEAAEIAERYLPEGHPLRIDAVGSKAWILAFLGRRAEAEPLLRAALAAVDRSEGPSSPRAVRVAKQLVYVLCDLKKATDARDLAASRYALAVQVHGQRAGVTALIGLAYAEMIEDEAVDKSIAVTEEALAAIRETAGDNDPQVPYALVSLARRYLTAERFDRALASAEQGLVAIGRTGVTGPGQRLDLTHVHALALAGLNRVAEATRELRQLAADMTELYGPNDEEVTQIQQQLAQLQTASAR